MGNQSSVFNQLQGVANGTGPNPAQAMLNNSTGANVANQAALMASQRGASQNPALIARQAAQQGSQIQQNAAGQGAALQAQQSLGALNQMGGIAGQQAAMQANATNANTQAYQNQQNNLLGAAGNLNNASVGNQGNINNANAGLAGQTMTGQQNLIGNLMSGTGSAMMLAEGGKVQGPKSYAARFMAGGGNVAANTISALEAGRAPIGESSEALGKGASSLGKGLGSMGGSPALDAGTSINTPTMTAMPMPMASGGKVPIVVSPGEKILNPAEAKAAKSGANPMAMGKTVPGKAKVSGAKDSYKNDVIPTNAEPGSLVIPRSVTQGKNPHWAAKKFVESIMMANGGIVPEHLDCGPEKSKKKK